MKLYFVGMPGSGKSTIGKKVAKELKLDFYDLDKVIVKKEGKSISEIFQENGEDFFRELEAKYLKELTEKKGTFVLACGGGTPCHYNNMDLMNKSGMTIYLEMSNEAVLARVKQSDNKRPLFANQSDEEMLETITKLANQRIPFYQKAQLSYSALDFKLEKFFDKLFEALK